MKILSIILLLVFVGIIIYQIRHLRELQVPVKLSKSRFYISLTAIFIILMFIFLFGYTWIDYCLGAMASIIIFLFVNISGISSMGFVYLESSIIPTFIPWKKINAVEIVCDEDIEITITTTFEKKMIFDRHEFNAIVEILKDNLPNDIVEFK